MIWIFILHRIPFVSLFSLRADAFLISLLIGFTRTFRNEPPWFVVCWVNVIRASFKSFKSTTREIEEGGTKEGRIFSFLLSYQRT